jgi:hypothetical protein
LAFPRRAGEEDADCFHGERKVNKKIKNYILIGRSYWGELIIGDSLWHLPKNFKSAIGLSLLSIYWGSWIGELLEML